MAGESRRVASLFATIPALLFVVLTLFLSLVYNDMGLTILSLLVLVTAGGLRAWGFFSLHGMVSSREVDKGHVFAGEDLTLLLSAENRKFLPIWIDLEVPVDGLQGRASEGVPFSAGGGLFWYGDLKVEKRLEALERGVHEIGPLRVTCADLPGFFPKEKTTGAPFDVIVYPRLLPLGRFSFPRRDFFGQAGSESPVKDPLYILGTTDYRQGRPARYIHWKASARHHRLQEKLFEPSLEEKALIVVDVAGFMDEEEPFERALEVAASLVVQLDKRGKAVGFLTNGARKGESPSFLPVTRSGGQLPAILEVLARLSSRPEGGIEGMMGRGLPLPWGVTCLYLAHKDDPATRIGRECFLKRRIPVKLITMSDLPGMIANPPAPVATEPLSRSRSGEEAKVS